MQINDVGMTRRHFQDGEIGRVRMIVLHATAGRAPGDYHWLRQGGSSAAPVSIHYYIDKAGSISRMVDDEDIAWHAGRSTWEVDGAMIPYNVGCNGISIGIELENLNNGSDPYPQAQYDATLWLVRHLAATYGVPRSLLVRHLDIAPQRKTDPRAFPWERFVSEVYDAAVPADEPADEPAAPPPDEPAAPAPEPLPADEHLRRRLVDIAYRAAGTSCPEGWPLLRAAVSRETGMPVRALTPDADANADPDAQARAVTLPGQAPLVLEAYGRDLFYAPPDNLEQVRRLGDTPSGPLRDALLHALFRAADPAHGFRPDWAFHQFYLEYMDELGVPLGPSYRLPASGSNGRGYVCQHFALDSLCAPVGQWRQISRLSELAPTLDAAEADERRDLALLLLNDLYRRRSGRDFDPTALFCRYAIAQRLGAPLGKAEYLTLEGQKLVAMPFALDVIYCRVPEDGAWADVAVNVLPAVLGADDEAAPPIARLSELLKQAQRSGAPAVLGGAAPEMPALPLASGVLLGAEAAPPLLTDIVIPGETAPLREEPRPSYLAICAAPGPTHFDLARRPAWHYYIDSMGGIMRLLDEAYVARALVGLRWHGQAGLEQHALAVAIEGGTAMSAVQQGALRRLLADLMPRYGLRREHLLRALVAEPAPPVAALPDEPAPAGVAPLQHAEVGGG